MNKKLIVILSIILICMIFYFLWVKFSISGNTNINQDDVKDIFNMQEYEAEIEVTVKSNKNENKYKIKQQYAKNEDKKVQEILEPENLHGVKITKQENRITLENTQLNLNKIFEEYTEMAENDMDLENFVDDYKETPQKSSLEEKDKEIILKTVSKNDNKYVKNKTLYIDKTSRKPTKMEIEDVNKKTTVYIVYTKVEIR